MSISHARNGDRLPAKGAYRPLKLLIAATAAYSYSRHKTALFPYGLKQYLLQNLKGFLIINFIPF